MNGGNESSGADRAGGPVATSVPIGWQRCVREGAVLYIRYRSSKFSKTYLPGCLGFLFPTHPLKVLIFGILLSSPFLSIFTLLFLSL